MMKKKAIFTGILFILLIISVYARNILNVNMNNDGVVNANDVKLISSKKVSSNTQILDDDANFQESGKDFDTDNSLSVIPAITTNYANDGITSLSNNTEVTMANVSGKVVATAIAAKTSNSTTSTTTATSVKKLVVYNTANTTASSTYLYLNLKNKNSNGEVTVKLGAKINGKVASGVTWKSSKPSVAKVDSRGTVTAVSLGKTTITASSGGVSGTYVIRVKKKVIIVIGASQVDRLSCYVTDNSSPKIVTTKTKYCVDSIVNGKYQFKNSARDIGKISEYLDARNTFLATNGYSTLKGLTSADGYYPNSVYALGKSQLSDQEKEEFNRLRYDDTLIYIPMSGSGFEFQTGGDVWSASTSSGSALKWKEGRLSGWDIALDIINSYSSVKGDVGFYIYFPIAGNATIDYGCNNWSYKYQQKGYDPSKVSVKDDADNFYEYVNQYLQLYSNNINTMRDEGYYVWGYIVSAHPLVPSNDTSGSIRYSNAKDACRASYTNSSGNKVRGKRSNLKYYLFNEVIEELVKSKYASDYFKYVDTFSKIMDVTVDNSKTKIYEKYSLRFKDKYGGVLDSTLDKRNPTNYGTDDGLHWNKDTVNEYLKLMIEDNSRLK